MVNSLTLGRWWIKKILIHDGSCIDDVRKQKCRIPLLIICPTPTPYDERQGCKHSVFLARFIDKFQVFISDMSPKQVIMYLSPNLMVFKIC